MKLLLLLLVCLVSGFATAVNEGEECPTVCFCSEESVGPYVARCSKLDAQQKFGSKISRVIIENDNSLILDKKIFQSVGLENVSTLQIVNCTIKKLDSRAFAGLGLLRTLEFVSNKQLVLDADMFNATNSLIQLVFRSNNFKFSKKSDYLFDIPLLRYLIMSNEGISELHADAFLKMSELHSINLASNKIKNLGKEFENLSELEDVDLSHNLLGEIGPDVFKSNENIDTLNFRGNPLTTMSDVHLSALTVLDVSSCKFSKIDKTTFSGFSAIQRLNLSGNALSEIAEDTFSLTKLSALQELDMSHNALKGPLPEDLFKDLSDLGVLNLAHNPNLQSLPDTIFQGLHDLFKLDLSFCGIKTLEETLFQDLGSLSFLNLAGNSLDRLKPGVLNKYIVNLDLSYNKIEHLEDVKFASDSRLKKLKLTGNKLSDLSTSALGDLALLESLDLSSCSLNHLWNADDHPTVLESLQTLSVAKNYISVITEEQLALTPNLLGMDIVGNDLNCDESFNVTLKWFREHNVKPSVHKLAEQKMENLELTMAHSDTEDVSVSGWGDIREQMCGYRDREPLEPLADDDENNLSEYEIDEGDDDDEDEDEDEEESEDEDEENYPESDATNIPNDDINSIVWRQNTILAESNDNYLWSVIIVLFSVVAILFSLTILAACVLRWSRQRNSYGARMINTHLHPPKMIRGRSSIYEQLYEDPNHPTTPIMSMKHPSQTQYNFPEGQGGKQYGYITYLSKDFHDSTVIPESV